MNKEEINELMKYNLEYLEARNSEEVFGGDYTSSVDLKYANKEIEQLQQENKQLKEEIDKYKRLLEYLKTLNLYEYDVDYDYDENPIDNYYPSDMKYHIENWLKAEEIDKED